MLAIQETGRERSPVLCLRTADGEGVRVWEKARERWPLAAQKAVQRHALGTAASMG